MVSEAEFFDLVIIGGGPGGLSAGIYAMRAALKVVLIEKGLPGGQINLTESVENYPGFENISGFDLSQKVLKHAKSYGLKVIQQEVAAVEPGLEFHAVRLADGELVNTHAVIIATGGSPRKLGVPGELEYYGKGVSYCATCDGFFFRGKDVIVVGGGDTALEEALYLAKVARHVYLAHRRDALRGSRILQQRVMAEAKIDILWNTIIAEILADDQGVRGVSLRDTQTGASQELAVDGVFIFIGFIPNNQLVPAGIRMDHDGYVETDEKCETNLPGIFVIGDLRRKYAKQIVLAAADGCTAALAAAHWVEMKKAGQAPPA
ncbi:MAG: thioredoxin-disulfide reductase [Thermodesulfobacteriota bacterium]